MAKYIKLNHEGLKTFPGFGGAIDRAKLRALKSGEAAYLEEQELAYLQRTCYHEVAAPAPEPTPEPIPTPVEEEEVKAQPIKKPSTR